MIECDLAYEKLEDICGWILTDGSWLACDQFWHIQALYDLCEGRGERRVGPACAPLLIAALQSADEGRIRHEAAASGLIKVWQNTWDGLLWTEAQLRTLQNLYALVSPDQEIQIFNQDTQMTARIDVRKIIKAKSVQVILRLFTSL